jgi:hypothetical protein
VPDLAGLLDDAELARSTIFSCPAVQEPPATMRDDEKKSVSAVFEPVRVDERVGPKNA